MFQTFQRIKCIYFPKIWFVKHLQWFILMIFCSCQCSNHICCKLSNNFKILLGKKIWNWLLKNLFLMLPTVKYLGHEFSAFTIKSIHSKIDAIHKTPSPTTKTELMRFNGSVEFFSKCIEKFHLKMEPLYDLLHKNINFY